MCTALVHVQRHPPNASVWEQAFSATDVGLECDDGCTATAALAWLDEGGGLNLQTANVGDSSGIWIATSDAGPPQVQPLPDACCSPHPLYAIRWKQGCRPAWQTSMFQSPW